MEDTKILNVTDDVSWIGVLDKDIRTFDIVMETSYGTTYNSYFINADKLAIVEATKEKFWDIYLAKLNRLCDPSQIEYIILNHTEPDHSGNVINLLKIAPRAIVVGSGNVIRYMSELMNVDFPHIVVKDGETLSLGNKTLRFVGAPNLHWPDSMYTYLEEDKVLFTCDSFGAHFCHPEMYEDKVGNFDDAFKYYFDVILKPYSRFMLKAIEKTKPLEINAVCTGHGPLLTANWKRYVDLSEKYARQSAALPEKEKVFIAYVSAYGKTGMLAEAIAKGIREAGIEAAICDIEKMPTAEIDDHISTSTALILGSPTINQNTLMQIYSAFALICPIRDKGKLAGCFGSYGWSGEAKHIIEGALQNLKLEVFPDGVFVKFTPSADDLKKAAEYGFNFGKKMRENSFSCKG